MDKPKISVIAIDGDDIPQEIIDLARSLGAEIVGMSVGIEQGLDPDCDCIMCSLRREHEAKYPGRNVLHHPSLTLVEDPDGVAVRDIIRHRLFKDRGGNTMFFNSLFHPMHELNLYTVECEKTAIEDFDVEPVLDDAGNAVYQTVDFRHDECCELEHVRGTMTNERERRSVAITAIAGPAFDEARANRLARVN